MKKQELKQLRKLIAEKADLEDRIQNAKFNPREEVADTAKDYSTGYGKTIIIRGYGDAHWKKLRHTYGLKLVQTVRKIELMEMFLDSIKDAEIRQILRYRYIDGMTHEQIGERIGYSRQAVQKKEERFWKENEEHERNQSTQDK